MCCGERRKITNYIVAESAKRRSRQFSTKVNKRSVKSAEPNERQINVNVRQEPKPAEYTTDFGTTNCAILILDNVMLLTLTTGRNLQQHAAEPLNRKKKHHEKTLGNTHNAHD